MDEFFEINSLIERLGVKFNDPQLLIKAFTHRSFCNEHQELNLEHNERLEFLGDSILGMLVSEFLYKTFPDVDEGVLSSQRSYLVDAPACAGYIQKLGVEEFLLLGRGEQRNRGKGRESILADLFEALIGALYLDQGIEAVRQFFFERFKEEIAQKLASPARNWKAELQDYAQKNLQMTPFYEVLEEVGPDHHKTFRVAVWIGEERFGEGMGFSKKEAQVAAAEVAMRHIEEQT